MDVVLVLAVLLGLHYRPRLPPLVHTAWLILLGAIVVVHGAFLVHGMHDNVAALREADYLGFWINAHVAASGHNFYDPAYGLALAQRFTVSDVFRHEILEVGFWYPPPSIFVFLPLAAFANPYHGMIFWYGIQALALAAAIVLLARTFLPADGPSGIWAVAALVLMLPATVATIQYTQSTFCALLFTVLFWDSRKAVRAGTWLVLAACVKPFIGALALALAFRRRVRPLMGAAATAAALSLVTLAVFGWKTFFTYFRSRPDARIPAFVYGEETNASLLGFIVRGTHGVQGAQLSHLSLALFAACAALLAGLTLWLALRSAADDDVLLSLFLCLTLLIYPPGQTFYTLLLIVPALVLWSRRSRELPAWFIACGLCFAYALTTRYPVFATLLGWLTFAVLAAPERWQALLVRFARTAPRALGRTAAPNRSARSTALPLALAFGLALSALALQYAIRPERSFFSGSGTDFRAFYCSGAAVNAGRDPYRVEPLRSCEHRVQPAADWSNELVVPAPLPGYDIAFFALLARAPYAVAKALWLALAIAALVASAYFLARLTGWPALPILLALSLSDGYQSLVYGQLPPLVVGALCAAAYCLQRRRYGLAVVAAAVTLIEPHLGVPACLGMLLWYGRTRPAFAAVAALLLMAAFAALGSAGNAEYFFHVLPQHAAAELVARDQYGLAHELHVAGLPDRTALALGSASYAVMVVTGLLLGGAAAAARRPAAVVLVPPAAVLLGGTFIHGIQFAAALPAAFLLVAGVHDALPRRLGGAALALLVVPWDVVVPAGGRGTSVLALSLLAAAWVATVTLRELPPLRRALAAAATAGTLLLVLAFVRHVPGGAQPLAATPRLPARVLAAGAAASANWAAYLRAEADLSVTSPRDEAAKIPNWLAIVLLLIASAARDPRVVPRAPSDLSPAEVALSVAHGY